MSPVKHVREQRKLLVGERQTSVNPTTRRVPLIQRLEPATNSSDRHARKRGGSFLPRNDFPKASGVSYAFSRLLLLYPFSGLRSSRTPKQESSSLGTSRSKHLNDSGGRRNTDGRDSSGPSRPRTTSRRGSKQRKASTPRQYFLQG